MAGIDIQQSLTKNGFRDETPKTACYYGGLFLGQEEMAEDTEDIAPSTSWIQLMAGVDNQGMPVMERLEVKKNDQQDYQLMRSPLFVRDLAAGDIFRSNENNPADYQVIERSGNLAIRVFRRTNIAEVEVFLTPDVEKLGGSLDLATERALVYTLHVNIGFTEIEKLFDGAMASFTDSVWYYGNIYDREDGVTPINWWDEFLNQV